jgi:cysteine desulfurase / selenocysteine lyase
MRSTAPDFHVSVSALGRQRLDYERRRLSTLLRASVHYFNSSDELERFAGIA